MMTSKDLKPDDWIRIDWIPYNLYVIENDDLTLTVSSPHWDNKDVMVFRHWQFNYRDGKCWKFLGKSKPNLLYNKLTKLTGFVHPVSLMKH